MYKFGATSKSRLATCDNKLQEICNELIREIDFTVVCGYRTKGEQDAAVASKNSLTPWPTSKHNVWPSQAVDIAPYNNGIDWEDKAAFKELSERFKRIAEEKGIKIRWGGDFKTIIDMPHFELPL